MNVINAFIRKPHRDPFYLVKTLSEGSTRTWPCWPPDLKLPVSRLWEMNFYCFMCYPVWGILLQQLKQTKIVILTLDRGLVKWVWCGGKRQICCLESRFSGLRCCCYRGCQGKLASPGPIDFGRCGSLRSSCWEEQPPPTSSWVKEKFFLLREGVNPSAS